jgi:hypothetical protein
MELLEVFLRAIYFQVDKFFQQKDGKDIRSSLSPIISNICMEHSEKLDLDLAQHKPSLWFLYVDDKFCGLAPWPRVATEFPQTP